MKKQHIYFFDRNMILRLAVMDGDKVPAGYIIGKDWTVSLEADTNKK